MVGSVHAEQELIEIESIDTVVGDQIDAAAILRDGVGWGDETPLKESEIGLIDVAVVVGVGRGGWKRRMAGDVPVAPADDVDGPGSIDAFWAAAGVSSKAGDEDRTALIIALCGRDLGIDAQA